MHVSPLGKRIKLLSLMLPDLRNAVQAILTEFIVRNHISNSNSTLTCSWMRKDYARCLIVDCVSHEDVRGTTTQRGDGRVHEDLHRDILG